MRTTLLVLVSALVSSSMSAVPARADSPMTCPAAAPEMVSCSGSMMEVKETALDCPWAGVSRAASDAIKSRADVTAALEKASPKYMERIELEGKITSFKPLWGKSINFDEGVKSIIIAPEVIDSIVAAFGAPARDDRIVHAGIEHTYGYLLSNLPTCYGFKRLRWVRPDIEKGFDLPAGVISPMPKDGGLFANVTYFAGSFAFRGEADAMKIIAKGQGVSKRLKKVDLTKLKPIRVIETFEPTPGRTVQLRTDFVYFTHEKSGDNQAVLIYSVKDSNEKLPYLISMFPVADGFVKSKTDAKLMGKDQTIKTVYNAFVPGVTDAGNSFKGTRCVSTGAEKCE